MKKPLHLLCLLASLSFIVPRANAATPATPPPSAAVRKARLLRLRIRRRIRHRLRVRITRLRARLRQVHIRQRRARVVRRKA